MSKVIGDSMNRVAADGAWCLWQHIGATGVSAPAPGEYLLVRRNDPDDPHLGGFTFKRWERTKSGARLSPVSRCCTSTTPMCTGEPPARQSSNRGERSYAVQVDLHRLGELRSRAYHRAIAARLVDDPSIIVRARTRADAWEQAGCLHPHLAALWRDVLALSVPRLTARLVKDSEPMTLLRSSSPFAGELAPRERWQIWESVRREAET